LRFLLIALLAAACVVRGAWAQSRLVWDSVHSAALEHNRLGDNATRRGSEQQPRLLAHVFIWSGCG
jgi:hypothetical protein